MHDESQQEKETHTLARAVVVVAGTSGSALGGDTSVSVVADVGALAAPLPTALQVKNSRVSSDSDAISRGDKPYLRRAAGSSGKVQGVSARLGGIVTATSSANVSGSAEELRTKV